MLITALASAMKRSGDMDNIKTVDDLIRARGLSADEQEKLRDIIEECRVREVQIREASESAKRNLEGLSRAFDSVVDTIYTVSRAVDDLQDEVGRLQLTMMPAEQFFQA
jgi:hypothetical protein